MGGGPGMVLLALLGGALGGALLAWGARGLRRGADADSMPAAVGEARDGDATAGDGPAPASPAAPDAALEQALRRIETLESDLQLAAVARADLEALRATLADYETRGADAARQLAEREDLLQRRTNALGDANAALAIARSRIGQLEIVQAALERSQAELRNQLDAATAERPARPVSDPQLPRLQARLEEAEARATSVGTLQLALRERETRLAEATTRVAMLEIELRKTHDARMMELSSLRHEVERLRARESQPPRVVERIVEKIVEVPIEVPVEVRIASPPPLADHGEGAPSRQPR
jgi:hypothetical protein